MPTQSEKGTRFRALHQRREAFVIPNPWDAGTARVLAHAGFEALATTSSGFAFTQGRNDYGVTREELLEHLRSIVAATDLPVSADLENGFGDDPAACAGTIRLAAEAGVVGGSIEDATGRDHEPIYSLEHAAERVRAAAEAAKRLPFTFTLTARAENYLHGHPDLRDTIERLQAYQEAGADVLYAPGLKSREEIAAVVNAVDRPVNVLVGISGLELTQSELSAIGVRRLSLGGALCRVAVTALHAAAKAMREGDFSFVNDAMSSQALSAMLLN